MTHPGIVRVYDVVSDGPDAWLVMADLVGFGLTVAPCITGGAAVARVPGSLPFSAPEVVERGGYSGSSDLFALGTTLFTSVSGFPLSRLGPELE